MMLWNEKDLPQPPINTYKASKGNVDLLKLRNALQDGIKHFKNVGFLSSEAAIMSRILYRMKMKFRSAKDFKTLEKLNRSLNIYFNAKMDLHLKNILDMTPTKYGKDAYLPTKNMLSYVLVKLQGLVKLMERIYDTCLILATDLNQRLYVGHFWKLFLILFALVSRVSILVKFNTKFLCELYGKLLPHSCKLQNTGRNWLPGEYVFPSDLRTWLGVQWVYEEEFVDLTFEPTNEIMNFFNLVDDDDDVLFCDEYILLDDEDNQIANEFKKLSPIKETLTRNRMRGFSINEDDIGEEVTTEIIELNDTILNVTDTQMLANYRINDLDKSIHEDIGEEIYLTSNNDTSIQLNTVQPSTSFSTTHKETSTMNHNTNSSFNYDGNKSLIVDKNWLVVTEGDDMVVTRSGFDNSEDEQIIAEIADDALELEENSVIPIPDTPNKKKQKFADNSDIIILDDSLNNNIGQNTGKKKKKPRERRSKRIKEAMESDLLDPNNQAHKEIATKRKLEFHEEIPKKKIKKANVPLNPVGNRKTAKKKKRAWKRKQLKKGYNTASKRELNTPNLILKDPDISSLKVTRNTKKGDKILQEVFLKSSHTEVKSLIKEESTTKKSVGQVKISKNKKVSLKSSHTQVKSPIKEKSTKKKPVGQVKISKNNSNSDASVILSGQEKPLSVVTPKKLHSEKHIVNTPSTKGKPIYSVIIKKLKSLKKKLNKCKKVKIKNKIQRQIDMYSSVMADSSE